MKLKPSAIRLFLYFIITSLILLFAIISMCFTIFFFQQWNYQQWIILIFWFLLSVVFLILLLKNYYYTIEQNYFSLTRFKKEICYEYKDILYIDVQYSMNHSSILLILKRGEVKYFVKDKENKLLNILIEKCQNVIDKQSVIVMFPNLNKIIK